LHPNQRCFALFGSSDHEYVANASFAFEQRSVCDFTDYLRSLRKFRQLFPADMSRQKVKLIGLLATLRRDGQPRRGRLRVNGKVRIG
jgi:hypothetical protein